MMVAAAKTCPAQKSGALNHANRRDVTTPDFVFQRRDPRRPKLGSYRRAGAAGDHQAASEGPGSRVTDTTTRFAPELQLRGPSARRIPARRCA